MTTTLDPVLVNPGIARGTVPGKYSPGLRLFQLSPGFYQAITGTVTRAVERDDNRLVVEGWFSRMSPDLDNFVINPEGGRFSIPGFLGNNPRFLWMHDQRYPIGNVLDAEVRPGEGIFGSVEFDPEDTEALKLYSKVKRGFLGAFSIGFRALDEPKYENEKLYFGRFALLEVSLVTIPAHPEALVTGRSTSVADEEYVTRAVAAIRSHADGEIDRIAAAQGRAEEVIRRALDDAENAVALLAAEAVESRLGAVAELVDRNVSGRVLLEAARATSLVPRVELPLPSPAAPPELPAAPPSAEGIDQSLWPIETPPDPIDGHRHSILSLSVDGVGLTSRSKGSTVLEHEHAISNWVVIDRRVAELVSTHPGSLFPGQQGAS